MLCSKPSISDREQRTLLSASARGDNASFERIVDLYQAKIRAYSQIHAEHLNEQVDDLAQDIFLQIYLSAGKFNAQSSVNTWIFAVAKNTINNKRRKKRLLYFWPSKGNQEPSCELYDHLKQFNDGEFYYERSQNESIIARSLSKLSQEHREILVLFEYAELGYADLAVVLKIKIGSVKSRLFNARRALAKEVLALHEQV